MRSKPGTSLHLTNGDAAVYLFKKAGILGTHVPWRDSLFDGPVLAGHPLRELSRVRGAYLAERGYASPIKLLHDFERRDALFARAAEFEEIVLWFEHDLFDQLQILQILTELASMNLEPGRVSIVQTDLYLSSLTAPEIAALYPKRRTITEAGFAVAQRVWEAFTSSDPSRLLACAREDLPRFAHLRAALARLCEEYPWSSDGLSRSQRAVLQAVAQGAARTDELFRRAQGREEAPFLSDASFAAILRDLRDGDAPLVEDEDGSLVATALGRRVLAGEADWVACAAIDRWIGGVHLLGSDVPRWDDDAATFQNTQRTVGE